MKEITVYETIDGKRFDSKDDCYDYEMLIGQITEFMSQLKPPPFSGEGCAVKQEKEKVSNSFILFMYACANKIPLFRDWFIEVADGTRHMSHVLLSFRRNLQETARSECIKGSVTTFDYI